MYRQRSHYWSCSKFSQWIRTTFGGVEKPKSETWEGWKQWRVLAKQKNAFVYWLTEEGLDDIQNILAFPYDVVNVVRTYYINRYLDKLHYLPTKLTPGQYYEVDTRILHGLFETLVDFIEVEKAWMSVVFSKDDWTSFGFPWWYKYRILRWTKRFRSVKAGLAHLEWEISLGDTSPGQSDAAKEELDLYKWWKFERPARVDPFGTSLVSEEAWKLEEKYDQEDEEMLIRLIKIRKHLWT